MYSNVFIIYNSSSARQARRLTGLKPSQYTAVARLGFKCRATAVLKSNLIRHGSSTTFESGLSSLITVFLEHKRKADIFSQSFIFLDPIRMICFRDPESENQGHSLSSLICYNIPYMVKSLIRSTNQNVKKHVLYTWYTSTETASANP